MIINIESRGRSSHQRWARSKAREKREYFPISNCKFSSVQSFSHVQLFANPWTVARQASLSITNSQSLLKLMAIESVMPSNHHILCYPLLLLPSIFPSITVFSNVSPSHQVVKILELQASASVLPLNIQAWFPLELTGLISLLSKGLSRVFSNTTVQKHQFFGSQLSLWSNSHVHIWPLRNYSFDSMNFCWQSNVSVF